MIDGMLRERLDLAVTIFGEAADSNDYDKMVDEAWDSFFATSPDFWMISDGTLSRCSYMGKLYRGKDKEDARMMLGADSSTSEIMTRSFFGTEGTRFRFDLDQALKVAKVQLIKKIEVIDDMLGDQNCGDYYDDTV